MTARQVKAALIAAGVSEEAIYSTGRDEFEIAVLDPDTEGRCDEDKVKAEADKALDALGNEWGGSYSGSGSFRGRKGYVSKGGDFNDKSSPDHY